jgi:hypothetical protein
MSGGRAVANIIRPFRVHPRVARSLFCPMRALRYAGLTSLWAAPAPRRTRACASGGLHGLLADAKTGRDPEAICGHEEYEAPVMLKVVDGADSDLLQITSLEA